MIKSYILKGYVYNYKEARIIKVFNEYYMIDEYLEKNKRNLSFKYVAFVVEERLSYE